MTFVRKLHRGISNSSPPTRYARPPRSARLPRLSARPPRLKPRDAGRARDGGQAWQEGGLVRVAEDPETKVFSIAVERTAMENRSRLAADLTRTATARVSRSAGQLVSRVRSVVSVSIRKGG